jgi:hypothetical protein
MTMGSRHKYVGVIEEGIAMSLNSLKMIDTVCAAVKFTGDGRIVKRGKRYDKYEKPRNLAATASRMAKPWQSYFERTGKRWELEQDAKRKAKLDKRKSEDAARVALRNAAPELLAMLKKLSKAVRFGDAQEMREAAEEATALTMKF